MTEKFGMANIMKNNWIRKSMNLKRDSHITKPINASKTDGPVTTTSAGRERHFMVSCTLAGTTLSLNTRTGKC